MKSVKMSAKMFLAVAAVASVSLTSCEKEDFTVDVPNIEITNPEVQQPEIQDGIIFVQLTASSTDGSLLNGVSFEYAAGDKKGQAAPELIAVTTAQTLQIVAKKDGFEPISKDINVPAPVKGTMMTLPINFVMTKIDVKEEVKVEVEGVKQETTTVEDTQNAPAPQGGWVAEKSYVATVQVPTSAPFISAEQKEKLHKAIESNIKQEAATRATVEEIEIAKAKLKAKVDSYASEPATSSVSVKFTLTEAASKVYFDVKTVAYITEVKISTEINGTVYYVMGDITNCGMSSITTNADGQSIGHGHAHGDDNNAGGGIGGRA